MNTGNWNTGNWNTGDMKYGVPLKPVGVGLRKCNRQGEPLV